MKRKFTKITALLVTVALLMAVPTLSVYANEENQLLSYPNPPHKAQLII